MHRQDALAGFLMELKGITRFLTFLGSYSLQANKMDEIARVCNPIGYSALST
jgi:hypothetical protein